MAREVPMTLAEYKRLTGQAPPPLPTRPLPATDAEETLLHELQRLAKQHGWTGEHSVHPQDGIRCTLVRGTDLLVVQLLGARQKLTIAQQTWLSMLGKTGKVECYVWRPVPGDRATMQARLRLQEAR